MELKQAPRERMNTKCKAEQWINKYVLYITGLDTAAEFSGPHCHCPIRRAEDIHGSPPKPAGSPACFFYATLQTAAELAGWSLRKTNHRRLWHAV